MTELNNIKKLSGIPVGSGSDPRCELPAWLTAIEQSLKKIAAPRAV